MNCIKIANTEARERAEPSQRLPYERRAVGS
jgi:hypothetical protein